MIVDMVTNPISGATSGYNVPFSMLDISVMMPSNENHCCSYSYCV